MTEQFPSRTRVKICGLCRSEDLQAAVALGVDAIGLVFCEKSPRHLTLEQAATLAAETPAFVSVVALFLNPEADLVRAVQQQVQPELLQFHGEESADFCAGFGQRYLKAVAMGQGAAPARDAIAAHSAACGFILDSHDPGQMGGTGQAFDWNQWPAQGQGLILAGGLRPDNVAAAIRQARPYGLDVSSGVESAPGIKSSVKMTDFMRSVRAADAESTTGFE